MARTLYDATWRALSRIVDILDANAQTELTADAPAGLNVTAPASEAYYVLPNEAAVRKHQDINHNVRAYVFPSGERVKDLFSRGTSTQLRHDVFEVTIALHVRDELGADDYVDSWKTLTPAEREFRRCEALLGAFMDALHTNVRDADNVAQLDFVAKRSGETRFKQDPDEPGTWGSLRYDIHQLVSIPQQN